MPLRKGDNFYIISGGPCSGKTTLIEALRQKGFACVDEVGRQIIREQTAIDSDAVHWGNQVKFAELMLSRSMYLYRQITAHKRPVFFDRGIPELLGYYRLINARVPKSLYKAIDLYPYNTSVFIAPPWPEIYRKDAERTQDYEEAVATYEHILKAYKDVGYRLIDLPKSEVSQRVRFITDFIR